MKLSKIKPLHAQWISELYDLIHGLHGLHGIHGFQSAGIMDTIEHAIKMMTKNRKSVQSFKYEYISLTTATFVLHFAIFATFVPFVILCYTFYYLG